ncbi:hypothetical protein MFRU_007g03460 [Monilinia fructicola]|nr:hypothetical protein MFRU_007g03460 [Monilinia fructicola]
MNRFPVASMSAPLPSSNSASCLSPYFAPVCEDVHRFDIPHMRQVTVESIHLYFWHQFQQTDSAVALKFNSHFEML